MDEIIEIIVLLVAMGITGFLQSKKKKVQPKAAPVIIDKTPQKTNFDEIIEEGVNVEEITKEEVYSDTNFPFLQEKKKKKKKKWQNQDFYIEKDSNEQTGQSIENKLKNKKEISNNEQNAEDKISFEDIELQKMILYSEILKRPNY